MTKANTHRGFVLLLVLWTLVMLSAIGLGLAASVATEVQASQESWNSLQAERLAQAGHEVAAYAELRGIGTAGEDLSQLPIQPVIPGMTYRVTFESGTVDITLEGENGRIDIRSANEQQLTELFTVWTGDLQRSREIAASMADWTDGNEEPRLLGAEAPFYEGRGYTPRNEQMGTADLLLIKGVTPNDLAPSVVVVQGLPTIRQPLSSVVTSFPGGNQINPNYASRLVLESIPEMTPPLLTAILDMRKHSMFTSARDLQERTGLPKDSPLLDRLVFDRGMAPVVLAVARVNESPVVRVERRTRTRVEGNWVLAAIERTFPNE